MSTGGSNEDFGVQTLLGAEASELASTAPLEAPIVVHGSVQRLAAFAELPTLRSASAVLDAWDGASRTARAWSPADGPAYEIFPVREQLRALYDAGCTIVLEGVERFVPGLRPLCRALERDLDIGAGRVNVEAFCARGSGHGRAHFDSSFTFNCQLEGSKTWRLARHEAVRFPPTGMFLGRTPEPELARLLTKPLPDAIEGGVTFMAEPGTVVFLPPGVLHETHTRTGSYAIGFAIERTESLAGIIAEEISGTLQGIPMLRAARFGAQFQDIEQDKRVAADALRCLADAIESPDWRNTEARFRLRPGLIAEALGPTCIVLRGAGAARTFSLDEMPVAMLGWASGRSAFSSRDLAHDLPLIDPELADTYVQQLIHLGLVERVA
jgi:hypothetical protein